MSPQRKNKKYNTRLNECPGKNTSDITIKICCDSRKTDCEYVVLMTSAIGMEFYVCSKEN